jgi:hypothetical protein
MGRSDILHRDDREAGRDRTIDDLLTDPGFFQDPYPVYRRLRRERPVYWSEAWNAWILTRFDDAVALLRTPETYSSAGRFTALLAGLPTPASPGIEAVRKHYASGLMQSDPPDHSRMRQLVSKAFSPRRLEEMRPRVAAIVARLLDRAMQRPSFDAIGQLAKPLPALVISSMLGVPEADQEQMLGWSDAIVGFQATPTAIPARAEANGAALVAFEAYFGELLSERLRHPQDDLLSALAQAEAAGSRLSEGELLGMCTALYVAGHETTRNLIGNTLVCLFRHPEALEAIRTDHGATPGVIEEALRFESPIQRAWRRVTRDVSLDGRRLGSGQLVFMMLGAANRDPDHFQAPDRFDICRSPSRHIAFGMGVHFCLGAPLARIEGQIAIDELVRRLPRLQPASMDFGWNPNIHIRGVRELVVTG